MARKSSVIVVTGKEKTSIYNDAIVTKVHENSYDIQLSNGEIYKYVKNTSGSQFDTGNYVSILFLDEDHTQCRIIGSGKTLSSVSTIKQVIV